MLITIIYSAIYIYSLFLSNINLFCKIIMPSYTSYFINILLSTILHIRIHIYIHTHILCEHIGSKKKCPIGKKKDKEREREREIRLKFFHGTRFVIHRLFFIFQHRKTFDFRNRKTTTPFPMVRTENGSGNNGTPEDHAI